MIDDVRPQVSDLCRGRALYIGPQGDLYIGRRGKVFRSTDGGVTWRLDCFVPPRGWKPWAASCRLAARLLRYYFAAFRVLSDGTRVAVARDGIYRAGPGEVAMTRTFRYARGSRPLNLAADGQRLLFGEYGNLDQCEVCIYVSEDGGKTFDVGHRFPRGDVRHIHNILVDPYRNHYWVFAGDFGDQPGIAALSKDLKSVDWLCRGTKECRTVGAINLRDRLIYGTDSDREHNFLVAFEKRTGRVERILEVEGSSLYAGSFGPIHAIATCVEPNPACPSRESSLYLSVDGDRWTRSVVHRKDFYHSTYFQFGTIVLPYSDCAEARGMYSGQALRNVDDRVIGLDWQLGSA